MTSEKDYSSTGRCCFITGEVEMAVVVVVAVG